MNARAVSACYPRGNFYPLIDGPSTRYHRFTKPHFRACSTCQSCSQATLYLCALQTISNRLEVTFGRLRYFLGGDRPSQTTHQTLSLTFFAGLDDQFSQGGISPLPPPNPRVQFHRLPPILRRENRASMSDYSKAPRGLFVLLRVGRIFTANSISPSPSLRQRPDRYAFRAGRNLPDKEFRYLRTVIAVSYTHLTLPTKRIV